MDEIEKKLKKILTKNADKRILVLGTIGLGFSWISKVINIGKRYEKVLDDLFVENYGYIDPRYISDDEKKRIEDSIQIEKGTPLFSHKILDTDLIIFMYANPKILKILCTREEVSYYRALNLQKKLKEQIKQSSCQVIKMELYPKAIGTKTMTRNVYIYDDNDYDLTDRKKRNEVYEYENIKYDFRFPYLKIVTSLSELKRKQGFLLIINEKYLDASDYVEIDKKYRNLFKQFNLVYIVTKNKLKNDMFHLKYTNIYFVNKNFFNDEVLIDLYFDYLLNTKQEKFSEKKKRRLAEFNTYLEKKKTVKTTELEKRWNMTKRNIERYMNDYNKIYNRIGYDESKNEWYITKK